jgi:hypothetical protein
MTEEQKALELARDVLERTRNGLEWYQDSYPETCDGSDDETLAEIEKAIRAINVILTSRKDPITGLAIKAGLISDQQNGFDRTRLAPTEQRFAELIIERCVEVVMEGDRYRRDYFAAKIKQHFGVEDGKS